MYSDENGVFWWKQSIMSCNFHVSTCCRLDANIFVAAVSKSLSQDTISAWTCESVSTANGWTWSIWTGKLCVCCKHVPVISVSFHLRDPQTVYTVSCKCVCIHHTQVVLLFAGLECIRIGPICFQAGCLTEWPNLALVIYIHCMRWSGAFGFGSVELSLFSSKLCYTEDNTSVSSAISAWLTVVANSQIDRETTVHDICRNSSHLALLL